MRNVVLYPTYEYALRMRKMAADQAAFDSFATLHTTPSAFFLQAWDVWGDERKIVDGVERKIIVQSLLQQQSVLASTPGTIEALARFIGDYAGLPTLLGEGLARIKEKESLSENTSGVECAIGDVIQAYFETLKTKRFIELGEAIAYLSAVIPQTSFSFKAQPVLSESMKAFFAKRGVLPDYISEPPSSDKFWGMHQANGFSTVLLKPAGVDVQAFQIQSYIERVLQKRSKKSEERSADRFQIGIIAPNIQALHTRLTPVLLTSSASRGERAKIQLRDYVAFTHTEFGKALKALYLLLTQDPQWIEATTTFARSPYAEIRKETLEVDDDARAHGAEMLGETDHADKRSDLSQRMLIARKINAYLRSHHGTTPADAWAMLQKYFITPEYFEEFLTDFDASAGLAYFTDLANHIFAGDEVARRREVSAICAMRDVYDKAREYIAHPYDVLYLLDSLRVQVSYCHDNKTSKRAYVDGCADESRATSLDPSADGQLNDVCDIEIVCMGKNAMRSLMPDSYDVLIVADATSDDFSVVDKPGALESMRLALGLPESRGKIDEAYSTIASLMSAVRKELVFSVPQKNGKAEDVYPAFFCSEIVTHAPQVLQEEMGEEDLEATLTVCDEQMRVQMRGDDGYQSWSLATIGSLQTFSLIDMIRTVQEDNVLLPLLSPTDLETYHECPYKWFISKRIRPASINEGFDLLAAGNFVHAVFYSLYNELHKQGISRITPDDLDGAHRLLDSVIDQQMADQQKEKKGYIPMNKNEEGIYAQLIAALHNNLIYQAECFAGFAPTKLESSIEVNDEIDFAGARLHGRVDRIDTNREDGFIVIDYKGSVSKKGCGSKAQTRDEVELPRNLQALIYAQAIKRQQEKKPYGAFYLNYKAKDPKNFLAGSYNPAVFDLGQFATKKSEVELSFDIYLDQIEALCESLVGSLRSGNIAPNPQSSEACQWCPAFGCPLRLM